MSRLLNRVFIALLLSFLGLSGTQSFRTLAQEEGPFRWDDADKIIIGMMIERAPSRPLNDLIDGLRKPQSIIYELQFQSPETKQRIEDLERELRLDGEQRYLAYWAKPYASLLFPNNGDQRRAIRESFDYYDDLVQNHRSQLREAQKGILHQTSQRERSQRNHTFGPISIIDIDRSYFDSKIGRSTSQLPVVIRPSVRMGKREFVFDLLKDNLQPTKGALVLTKTGALFPKLYLTVGFHHLERTGSYFCNKTLQGIVDKPIPVEN